MRILHNIMALNTARVLGGNKSKSSKSVERLASGLLINSAAADAAGLAISEKMRAQIRGLNRAPQNAQDGISLIQTAEGALYGVHGILQRMRELSVQASSDTYNEIDRQNINEELKQLSREIDDIGAVTEFNTIKIFTNAVAVTAEVKELFRMIFQVWAASAIDAIHKAFPSLANSGAGKTMQIHSADFTTMGETRTSMTGGGTEPYILRINTDYFDPATIGWNSSGILVYGVFSDQIIAGEMMKAAMYDTLGPGMTNGDIPSWFKEGVAEAVAGGFNRDEFTNLSNSDIQNGLGTGGLTDITSGYTACMYLGYLVGSGAGVDSANIADGLNKIFSELATGASFDDALFKYAGMTGDAFISNFQSPVGDTFLDALRQAVVSGSGSVVAGSLSTSPEDTISDTPDPYSPDISANYFTVSDSLDAPLIIQTGANSGENLMINRYALSANILGLPLASALGTRQSYGNAIKAYDAAINIVSNMCSYYGTMQNRLEHKIKSLDISSENLSAAESRIRDVDMAKEMTGFVRNNILQQAATATLAQANQHPQTILRLLR